MLISLRPRFTPLKKKELVTKRHRFNRLKTKKKGVFYETRGATKSALDSAGSHRKEDTFAERQKGNAGQGFSRALWSHYRQLK